MWERNCAITNHANINIVGIPPLCVKVSAAHTWGSRVLSWKIELYFLGSPDRGGGAGCVACVSEGGKGGFVFRPALADDQLDICNLIKFENKVNFLLHVQWWCDHIVATSLFLVQSSLSHNLVRSLGSHRWRRNNPFSSCPVSSCPSWADKSNIAHSLILCFPPLLSISYLFPFNVPCSIVFARSEDLETWQNYLSFCSLTLIRSSSYSPMTSLIFLRTSSKGYVVIVRNSQ